MLFEEQISRKPDQYPWTKQFIDAIWQGFGLPTSSILDQTIRSLRVI